MTGRLTQIWDTDRWNIDFPAELASFNLSFRGCPAVFPTNAAGFKKGIYAITCDGRLAQIWDTDRWNIDFPAELAGSSNLRFHGSPAVFAINSDNFKKGVYII